MIVMKKTLVALAVAAMAATSANAATVYEQDGTKVELSGSLRLLLGQLSKDNRGDLINDDSRVWVKASQDLGNGLSALGGFELRFDNIDNYDSMSAAEQKAAKEQNTFRNPRARQVFGGFAHKDVGTLTFGRQETTLDTVQLSDFAYSFGGNNNLTDYAEKSVKFRSAEWAGFSFGADYLFGTANKSQANTYKYGYGVSAFYSQELAKDFGLNLAAGYGVDKYDDANTATSKTGQKDQSWRTSAQLVFGPASLGVEFGRTDVKVNKRTTKRGRNFLFGAKYQVIEPTALYFQYQNNQTKVVATGAKETENKYVVGADYKLHKNVVTYVELARSLTKDNAAPVVKGNDTAYGVGLRVFF